MNIFIFVCKFRCLILLLREFDGVATTMKEIFEFRFVRSSNEGFFDKFEVEGCSRFKAGNRPPRKTERRVLLLRRRFSIRFITKIPSHG
jgi:hypothetical protein